MISMFPKPSNHIKTFFDWAYAQTGIKQETIFTVCVTLFVFSAGIFANWVIKKLNERRLRKNYVKTSNLLLISLANTCKRQYQITNNEIISFSLLDGKSQAFKMHVYSPLNFLNKMDHPLFIKYYVRGFFKTSLKSKAVLRIFQIMSYCDVLQNKHEETIMSFFDSTKPLQETYLTNILTLERFGKNLNSLTVTDYDYKLSLLNIFEHWSKHTDNHFRTSFTHLISPLIRLLERFQLETSFEELTKITQECHFAYSEMAHTEDRMREVLKHFAFENRKMYQMLNVIFRIFRINY